MSIEISNDPAGFHDFEHTGWETVSQHYAERFAQLTTQSVQPMLDAAEVTSATRMLDVCCGPGMLAAAASARGTEVQGVDFSQAAIDIARKAVPAAQFKVGDAMALSFPSDSFDAVTCGFGIIHVANPLTALQEMHRVLKPGGHVAVSVWDAPTADNGFGILFGAIQAHGNADVELPHGPDFLQFSQAQKLQGALQEAGFKHASTKVVPQVWKFFDDTELLTTFLQAAVRSRALLLAQTDAAQAAIAEAVSQSLQAFKVGDARYQVPMPALIGMARK